VFDRRPSRFVTCASKIFQLPTMATGLPTNECALDLSAQHSAFCSPLPAPWSIGPQTAKPPATCDRRLRVLPTMMLRHRTSSGLPNRRLGVRSVQLGKHSAGAKLQQSRSASYPQGVKLPLISAKKPRRGRVGAKSVCASTRWGTSQHRNNFARPAQFPVTDNTAFLFGRKFQTAKPPAME